MADRYGGVGPKFVLHQQKAYGFTHDITPPYDDHLGPLGFYPGKAQHLEDPMRSTGKETVLAQDHMADRNR
jgi:hypothetical protein